MKNLIVARLALAACLVLASGTGVADDVVNAKSDALYDELLRMDRLLFEAAFVACDANAFRSLFTEDAEFYHDLAGPTFGEEVWTLNNCPRDNGVRRVLVPESVEVYPMEGYGAIQMGEHWFVEEGAQTSTLAKFVHLWRKEDGEWRLARVLSFDHQSKPKSEGPRE
ncbi:MAG TPA: nuclear transport factor 2 family protein [Gammaproteobacteria bacterium]